MTSSVKHVPDYAGSMQPGSMSDRNRSRRLCGLSECYFRMAAASMSTRGWPAVPVTRSVTWCLPAVVQLRVKTILRAPVGSAFSLIVATFAPST